MNVRLDRAHEVWTAKTRKCAKDTKHEAYEFWVGEA